MSKVIKCKSGEVIYVPELYFSGSIKAQHAEADNGLYVNGNTTTFNIGVVQSSIVEASTPEQALNKMMSYFNGNYTDLGRFVVDEERDIIINTGVYLNMSALKQSVLINPIDSEAFMLSNVFRCHLTKSGTVKTFTNIATNNTIADTLNTIGNIAIKSVSTLDATAAYRYPYTAQFITRPMIVEVVDSDGYKALALGTCYVTKVYSGIGTSNYVWKGNIQLIGASEAYAEVDDPHHFNYKYIGEGVFEPDDTNSESTTGGGDGTGQTVGDDITLPGIDGLNNSSAVNAGLVNLYKLDNVQMASLGQYMWSDDFIENIKKLKQSPMDVVISLMSMPVPIGSGSTSNIKLGNLTSPSTGVIVNQYIEVDCGTLNLQPITGSCFDYSPYTKAELYLPFCGNHPVDVDDLMGKTISIKYYVDLLSGSCTAFVLANGSCLYNFSGTLANGIPLSAVDRSQETKALLQMGAGIIGAAAGAVGAAAGAPTGSFALSSSGSAVQGAIDAMLSKNTIEHGGSLSGDSAVMGIKTPYLILVSPRPSLPTDYNEVKGYPCNITYKLGDIDGYTEISFVNLKGFGEATDTEIQELYALLSGGIIL